jgi:hypothetical protein
MEEALRRVFDDKRTAGAQKWRTRVLIYSISSVIDKEIARAHRN